MIIEKNILLVVAVMCAAAAAAREIVVDALPPSEFADTETSTNVVFDAGSELGMEVRFR